MGQLLNVKLKPSLITETDPSKEELLPAYAVHLLPGDSNWQAEVTGSQLKCTQLFPGQPWRSWHTSQVNPPLKPSIYRDMTKPVGRRYSHQQQLSVCKVLLCCLGLWRRLQHSLMPIKTHAPRKLWTFKIKLYLSYLSKKTKTAECIFFTFSEGIPIWEENKSTIQSKGKIQTSENRHR